MLGREPVLWMALIQAGIALGVGFGLAWTGEQVALVTTFAAALLAFIARSQVTPTSALRLILLCLLLGSGFGLSACATRVDGTQVSPEGTIALRGTAVVNAIKGTAPAIEALTLPNSCGPQACMTAAEGVLVARTIDQGLQAAEQLPPILTTVDAATDAAAREHGMAKARAVLQEISRAVAEAQILPALGEARTKVVAVLLSVQLALLAVKLVVNPE